MDRKPLVIYTGVVAVIFTNIGGAIVQEAWRKRLINRKAMLGTIMFELVEKARDKDFPDTDLWQWLDKEMQKYNYPLDQRAKKGRKK